MHVLMVDDHVMFMQGLKNLLHVMAPALEVDCADSVEHAIGLLDRERYDLVLLDWHLSDCDGANAMGRLRDAGCAAPIVILSGETRPSIVEQTVEMGAAGFIPKQYSSEMMISALDQVLGGCVFLPGADAPAQADEGYAAIEDDPRLVGLTPRQLDVYRAAARGLPNKLIARELGIARSTVKSHLAAVFTALGVHNRTEATYLAARERTRVFPPLHNAG